MRVSDIVVIGAGIAGAGAAFRLADRGLKPVVVERAFPASGPTGKSSAITHRLLPDAGTLAARDPRLRHPAADSRAHRRRACISEVGMMWVTKESARPVWATAAARIRDEGARIETLSVEEFARRAPGFTLDEIAMAVWEPDYGYADPYGATTALIDGAKQRGARVLNNSIAERIHLVGGKVAGVELSTGERIACDRVVVAVGVWSKRFFAKHGIDLPVTIERHPMAVLDAPGKALDIMPFSWCDDAMLHYGRPDGDSRILVGTWAGGGTGVRHNEQKRPRGVTDPDQYEIVDLDESSDILSWALPRIPAIAELGIRKGYAGLYDMSPDDNPILDQAPGIDGLFYACGSSGHGFKLGAAVGEALADWALGEKTPAARRLHARPLHGALRRHGAFRCRCNGTLSRRNDRVAPPRIFPEGAPSRCRERMEGPMADYYLGHSPSGAGPAAGPGRGPSPDHRAVAAEGRPASRHAGAGHRLRRGRRLAARGGAGRADRFSSWASTSSRRRLIWPGIAPRSPASKMPFSIWLPIRKSKTEPFDFVSAAMSSTTNKIRSSSSGRGGAVAARWDHRLP